MPGYVFGTGGTGGGENKTLPPMIQNLAFIVGNGSIALSWALPAMTENYAGLRFVYKTNGQPTGPSDGTKIELSNTVTTHTITGLTNGTIYYVRAFPYNSDGQFQTMLPGAVIFGTPMSFQIPTFTGDHTIYGNASRGYIEMRGSGTLTLSDAEYNVFLVGGGGAGGVNAGSATQGGGGGGYTTTVRDAPLSGDVAVVVGAGAAYYNTSGGTTSVGGHSVSGASAGTSSYNGRNGGSGGGSGAYSNSGGGKAGGSDGSDGGGTYGGSGQQTTTRSFGEATGTLYAGGGGGSSFTTSGPNAGAGAGGAGGGGAGAKGDTAAPKSGTPNTGGGGGGVSAYDLPHGYSKGGSGIALLAWGGYPF